MDARSFLEDAGGRAEEAYRRELRLLPFERFLDLVLEDPYALGRSAVQYLVDAVDHFGTREVPAIGGTALRHGIWDAPFDGGRGAVHGQEAAQERIVRLLRTAAEEGRLDRVLVLHGPNGSAKSTLVDTLFRGLSHYSRLPEGVLYRFHWVFPRSGTGEELGFGGGRGRHEEPVDTGDSYALLGPEEIAARVACDLRDNPFLLLPRGDRARLLADAAERKPFRRTLRHLAEGDLCPKCKAIFEALLAGYHGDLRRVLRHVQVERWFIDPRFRRGAVVVPPQGSVDASVREVSAGISSSSLPPLLQHVPLLEASGDLVDANRGGLEFSDFLKRPIELFKYLLGTSEKGTVAVGPFLAHLSVVLFATTNEKYLDAFKSSPDWTSFKARMELVPVPYLLEPGREEAIYRDFAASMAPGRHVPPHLLAALAQFSVLTRLEPPDPERYPEGDRRLVEGLTPPEKLRLYETGEAPERLGAAERRALHAALPEVRDESRDSPHYEGRFGASAREIRSVLSGAAADPEGRGCLSPDLVFGHLKGLLRERTVYDFLKIQPSAGYHDPDAFEKEAEAGWTRRSLDDIQEALELVPAREYERRFERYVSHAVAFTQKERLRNAVSGEQEPPDEDVMRSVERLLKVPESPAVFRQNLVARIGAYGLENPGKKPDLRALFPEVLRALRKDYFETIRSRIKAVESRILSVGSEEFEHLDAPQREEARRALRNLEGRFGYCATCAREAVSAARKMLEE